MVNSKYVGGGVEEAKLDWGDRVKRKRKKRDGRGERERADRNMLAHSIFYMDVCFCHQMGSSTLSKLSMLE